MNASISCGVSKLSDSGYQNLFGLYKQAMVCLEYVFTMGRRSIIFPNEFTCNRVDALNDNVEKNITALRNFLEFPESNNVSRILSSLCISDKSIKTENFKEIIMEKSKPREPTNDKVIIKEIITLGDLQCAI